MNQDVSLVNSLLDVFFEQSIKQAAKIDPSYERLWKSLHSLIQSGGKRLRPQMTLLSYQAFGGTDITSVMPVAAAQELLHFSLLIHDDIIDREYVRYGVPNIAGQYRQAYASFTSSPRDTDHYANSAALLGGNLMLSGAHQLIASSQLSASDIATSQQLLGAGIFDVAGGELLDTELSFIPYKPGDALKVATYKTASYSFKTPLLTGGYLASASTQQRLALEAYAAALGIAYQLTDDLLGVFGDESQTGKSTTGDITEGKCTYMVEVALEAFSDTETQEFMQGFGNPNATTQQIEIAKQLLESSGARQQTEQIANNHAYAALRHLDTLDLSDEYHQQFAAIVTTATKRSR